jgi:hypothetical protein
MASLRVHGRDDAVRGGALGDPKAPVIGLLDVLADHDRQQRGRLTHPGIQRLATQGMQGPVAVAGQLVHQPLPRHRIVPVAGRLARRPIVV